MQEVPPTAHLDVVELEYKFDMLHSVIAGLLPVLLSHVLLIEIWEGTEPSAHW